MTTFLSYLTWFAGIMFGGFILLALSNFIHKQYQGWQKEIADLKKQIEVLQKKEQDLLYSKISGFYDVDAKKIEVLQEYQKALNAIKEAHHIEIQIKDKLERLQKENFQLRFELENSRQRAKRYKKQLKQEKQIAE